MKLPKVDFEEYLTVVLNLHLKSFDSLSEVLLITGDPVENYLPMAHSLTLDLRDFKLNFTGDKELMRLLKTEAHVNQYINLFHNTKGAKETMKVNLKSLQPSKGMKLSFDVNLNGIEFSLLVTLFDIKVAS